jgi:hypothetical protein
MHTVIEQNQTPPTGTPKRYQCRHIFTDGHRCGSPCLRSESLCYYHHTTRRPAHNPRARRCRRSTFEIPLPEDRSAIQHSIGQVLQRIAANDIDPRRAGLLLYGLQIASLNLPKQQPAAKSAPETANQIVEEITTDPELGVLAPPAEVGQATRRKSTIAQLLESMIQREQKEADSAIKQSAAEPSIVPTLQAAHSDARPSSPEMHHREGTLPQPDWNAEDNDCGLRQRHYFLENERTRITMFQRSSGFARSPSPGI